MDAAARLTTSCPLFRNKGLGNLNPDCASYSWHQTCAGVSWPACILACMFCGGYHFIFVLKVGTVLLNLHRGIRVTQQWYIISTLLHFTKFVNLCLTN